MVLAFWVLVDPMQPSPLKNKSQETRRRRHQKATLLNERNSSPTHGNGKKENTAESSSNSSKKLEHPCDWGTHTFTMDDDPLPPAVIKVFVDLYHSALLYLPRKRKPWSQLGTQRQNRIPSDIEVVYKEEHSKLYYLRYKISLPRRKAMPS